MIFHESSRMEEGWISTITKHRGKVSGPRRLGGRSGECRRLPAGWDPWEGANQHQLKVDPKSETERERASQISQMGTDGREEGIRWAIGAGEIKASASALAGDFDFPPLMTLWRARALPLCFDGHFIRVHSCWLVVEEKIGQRWESAEDWWCSGWKPRHYHVDACYLD